MLDAFRESPAEYEALRLRGTEDFGKSESPAIEQLQATQRKWVGLLADTALMAMSYRNGEFAAVPWLEPKSITLEPQVIYPFAA